MALTYSRRLLLNSLNKNCYKYALPLLSTNTQLPIPVVHYSEEALNPTRKHQAIAEYLQRVKEYNELIEEQLKEFNLGKKHLANIIGKREHDLSQAEIDSAIEYLFPSKLYEKRARPLMKPPHEIFPLQKSRDFDETGRPYHYLFYTINFNFAEVLHNAAKTLEELNLYETKMLKLNALPSNAKVDFSTAKIISKKDLQNKLGETVIFREYQKFVEIIEKLKNHPYNHLAKDFIKKYLAESESLKAKEMVKPTANEDGLLSVTTTGKRKSSCAEATVIYPGTGKLDINDEGIDYFVDLQSRMQVMFPLLFTDLMDKVDVKIKVEGGGPTGQSGAIRAALSFALESLVSEEMRLKMKVAGLTQSDARKRERTKCGKEGARRGYTWLKR